MPSANAAAAGRGSSATCSPTRLATTLPTTVTTAPVKSLSGAGSTLVAPLIAEWAQEFPVFYGVDINYASVGSQAGLNRLASGGVDFAATDLPLTSA